MKETNKTGYFDMFISQKNDQNMHGEQLSVQKRLKILGNVERILVF